MKSIPSPIFQDKLSKISWKKIYSREYGVQYSEVAILCLTDRAKHHIPKPSVAQVVIPDGGNTAFYIDATAWIELVESLNRKYTSNVKNLEIYEKQFNHDGKSFLEITKRIAQLNLKKLSNVALKKLYLQYQEKLFRYSIFAWTSFILNNYVADRATAILDIYIKKHNREKERQEILDSLFSPEKRAAVLQLQYEVAKHNGKFTQKEFDKLFEQYKWLSCLDIHNKPWTKQEFRQHIKSFTATSAKKQTPFTNYAAQLKIKSPDLLYLLMAKRFVYIKDARDDYRRLGSYYATNLFKEIGRRMEINSSDVSYIQEAEVIAFLSSRKNNFKKVISERKKGFVLYLDTHKKLICLSGSDIPKALKVFKLVTEEEKVTTIQGTVASKGKASGIVAIVKGIKDLNKVEVGNILVAVATHPDYVPAMRRASAIITDEGGITSHAAIVSREFGIPCIVGTKNATRVLKDGDRVEVNAVEGWVKKISS